MSSFHFKHRIAYNTLSITIVLPLPEFLETVGSFLLYFSPILPEVRPPATVYALAKVETRNLSKTSQAAMSTRPGILLL